MRAAPPRRALARGPAKLASDDLDDVFAGKGERTAPPAGAAPRSAPVPERPAAPAAGQALELAKSVERAGVSLSTIRIPDYLSERIADYLHVHRGDTMQTLFFKGLVDPASRSSPRTWCPSASAGRGSAAA